jgi:Fe2+ transport system protein FeoA
VVKIEGKGPLKERLSAMGVTPGATVEAVRRAPLGDPVEFRVRGYHLSLRKGEADLVEVEAVK